MSHQGHIFFDKETHAGEVCFYELISKYSGNNPAPSLLRGYAKVEPLSISELNQFVITGKPQEIEFVCTGKVIGIRWKFQRRVRNKKEIGSDTCVRPLEEQQRVCPSELERRLQELMETRQEEDIKELQTSLEEANKSLHVTASEASW